MQMFVQWAKKSTTIWQRILILGFGACLFLFLIPYLLIFQATRIDESLGIKSLLFSQIGLGLGFLLIILGGIFAIWTIAIQVDQASGTPFPMIPTKKLLTNGPFALCRNPMTLGTILAYSGVSLMIGSIASLIIVFLFGALLCVYLKRIEEKELRIRFGEEYVRYKAETPFMIPDLTRLRKK